MSGTRAKGIALVAVLQLMIAATAFPQSQGIDALFPAAPVGHVNDFASVVDPGSSATMEDLLARLRSATGAEVAVVTLPDIKDHSPNEVGVAIIRRWGIGAKADVGDARRNAGLVVLLVPKREGVANSGKIYVAVGQGLEGIITDAEAGRVSDQMLPELRQGQYGPALLTGVRSLTGTIARAFGVTDSTLANASPARPVARQSPNFMSYLPLVLFLIFLLMANSGRRGRRRVYWGGGPWIGGGWGRRRVRGWGRRVRRVRWRRWRERRRGWKELLIVHQSVERVVAPFLAQADTTLPAGYGAVLYGSAARGDFVPGWSDINLLLLADALPPVTLRGLGAALGQWRKASPEPPLLVTRAEWSRASDVFPIEITDMRSAHKVLRGDDPLTGVTVAPADLRAGLERELRGKLVRLRQGYAAMAGDQAALGAMAARSASTVLVLLRGLLTLEGRPTPSDPLQLASSAAAIMGIEGEAFLGVVRHRGEKGWRCGEDEFEAYLDAVRRATGFVDQLNIGDQR